MFARGLSALIESAWAVPGISWSSPRAPEPETARGFIRDSSHATAASNESGRPVSREAFPKAPAYALGIPHLFATAGALLAAVDFAGAVSTSREPSVTKPSKAMASTTARTVRQSSAERFLGSARRMAARRRDRAKTRSISARLRHDVDAPTPAASYPAIGSENQRPFCRSTRRFSPGRYAR